MKPILSIKGVNKRFGGLQALSDVALEIQPGQIYGLIGPNGAGKTTFFNVITGLYTPDSGSFVLDGVPYERHIRTKAGFFGAVLRLKSERAEEAAIRQRSMELLEYVGIAKYANYSARTLSYGDQRRLEIARALATEPKLLALDEPAAGMNATEKLTLRALLDNIRRDGKTILLIEHDVKLVMGLCDRMTVLDYGKQIAEGLPTEVRANKAVIEAYLGAAHA
jgi:branched-chain amino acid transport system ATP-binding protein